MGQKWSFCRRVLGGEVQKIHFWGSKSLTFEGPAHQQKIDPGYGPVNFNLKFKFHLQKSPYSSKNSWTATYKPLSLNLSDGVLIRLNTLYT